MPADDSVTTWLGQLKAGQSDAARRLWDRYYGQVLCIARAKLGGLSRREADEEDVALSAFGSFCQAAAKGRFDHLDRRSDLGQILVSITTRKARNERRRQSALRRGGGAALEEALLTDLLSREPDPLFAVLVADEVQTLLSRLKDEQMHLIAAWAFRERDTMALRREWFSARTVGDSSPITGTAPSTSGTWDPRNSPRAHMFLRSRRSQQGKSFFLAGFREFLWGLL